MLKINRFYSFIGLHSKHTAIILTIDDTFNIQHSIHRIPNRVYGMSSMPSNVLYVYIIFAILEFALQATIVGVNDIHFYVSKHLKQLFLWICVFFLTFPGLVRKTITLKTLNSKSRQPFVIISKFHQFFNWLECLNFYQQKHKPTRYNNMKRYKYHYFEFARWHFNFNDYLRNITNWEHNTTHNTSTNT